MRGLLAAQLVHKAQLHGFAAGEDFARGQTRGAGAIHMTALGHDVHELLVHVLEHALEIGLFFRGERLQHGTGVLVGGGGQGLAAKAQLVQQAPDLGDVHAHADGAGHGGGIGEDAPARHADHQAAGGRRAAHADGDGFVLAQPGQGLIQFLRGSGPAAGGIHTHQHALDAGHAAQLVDPAQLGVDVHDGAGHAHQGDALAAQTGGLGDHEGRDAAQQQDQQAPEDHGMTFAERHPEKVQPGLLRHMRKRAGRGAGEGRSRRGALAVADAFAGRGLAVHAQGMFREVVGSGSIQTQLGRSLPGTFGIIDLHGSVRVKNAGMAAKVRPLPQRDRLQGHAARDAPERAVRQAGNASRP